MNTKNTIQAVYDSIASCSSATHIPAAIIKKAKRAGCPGAFKSNRVYLLPLLKWIFDKDDETQTNWSEHGKKFDALIKEVKYNRHVGNVVNRDDVKSAVVIAISLLFSQLDRLTNEIPPAVKGMGEAQIKAHIVKSIEVIKGEFKKRSEETISNG